MKTIGKLVTFGEFIKNNNIRIPRIQRDYTYGSGTKKTEEVVEKLLTDISRTLDEEDAELILDFVYGSNDNQGNYSPLDGQQRLTTLFLLHLYASLMAGEKIENLFFHYATRDNTEEFCSSLLDSEKFKFDKEGGKFTDQIMDMPFFRASFQDDPSIKSMLAVLDKIESRFKDKAKNGELFQKLENDCRIKFYCLDFGKYGRADDLYIKMNSRGKPLTEYEIFKSQIEKFIELTLKDKDLKYEFAQKFDTIFTDLLWSENNYNLTKIDESFINLIRNILWLRNFQRGNNKYLENLEVIGQYLPPEPGEERENMPSWWINKEDIRFIIDFLDTFYKLYGFKSPQYQEESGLDNFWNNIFYTSSNNVLGEGTGRIRLFSSGVNLFKRALNAGLKNSELLMLYVQYYLLSENRIDNLIKIDEQAGTTEINEDMMKRLRHIRNLLENSENEIPRPDNIANMLTELEKILDGNIQSLTKSSFNTYQFEEEKAKDLRPDRWESLFKYEDHDHLRGAFTLLLVSNVKAQPDFDDDVAYSKLVERLGKIHFIFDNRSKENDHLIRAILLSYGDFGQISRSDIKYNRDNHMYGRMPSSWRNLLTINSNFNQKNILSVLDSINIENPFIIQQLPYNDWRYYATHPSLYEQTLYYSYNQAHYGYYYKKDPQAPLEIYLLQSTSTSDDNVMWKLLNWLLQYTLRQRGVLPENGGTLGNRKLTPELHLFDRFSINARQTGWEIGTEEFFDSIRDFLIERGYITKDQIIIVDPDRDFIEYGVKIVKDIKKYIERIDNYYPLIVME